MVWGTFGILGTDALLGVPNCALGAGRNANDAATTKQSRSWRALRDGGCQTVALTIVDRAGWAGRRDGGNTTGTIEGCIFRAGGHERNETFLTV